MAGRDLTVNVQKSGEVFVGFFGFFGSVIAFIVVLYFPGTCSGLTPGEKQDIRLLHKIGMGVVNVSSAPRRADICWQPVPPKGSASGFILDHLGHIVTSRQAVVDEHSIEITLLDGRRWPARIIGEDCSTDIAVLELRAPEGMLKGLPSLQIAAAASPAIIGQKVFAMGNPCGDGYTVAAGIVSSVGRSLVSQRGNLVDDVIQSDIYVNQGSAGGPLVDSLGRVIGMNTLIFDTPGQMAGMGFAISCETIEWVVSQLIARGYVERSWFGADLQTVTPELAGLLRLPAAKGALVVGVVPRGPAARAGIRPSSMELRLGNRVYHTGGDIIVAIDGMDVESDKDVIRILRRKEPGETVLVSLYRGDRLRKIRVSLGERGDDSIR
ncbi:MAG TPA: PDZ domain-containing protein [Thermodesulfobacteriaceae bacterium]|nr:PDZ domain-containing protein [Thermodesulfobacteriaceae bacterium]